jgi:hypothetical protein
MKNFILKNVILGIIFSLTFGMFLGTQTEAAVTNWQKGAAIIPLSSTDFGSESFKQSVLNLKSTGANYVSLVVPLYQSSLSSTDVARGWNTPTDASLNSAIDYIHAQGMKVMIKFHVESYGHEWRAYINPNDRNAWFSAYGGLVKYYAKLAEAKGVEEICLGAELISMSTATSNSTNTSQWVKLIGEVRAMYGGKLTYSANWGGSDFANEKNHIEFWSSLDYIGIAAYFNLNANGDVESLKGAWDNWNRSEIEPLSVKYNKPILFTEIGYRSVTNAHYSPWDYSQGGGADENEQANDYEALFSYWNTKSFMQGVHLWDWNSNPNSGGPGSTSYTPQNKKAQTVMKNWFTGAVVTPPPTTPPPVETSIDVWWPSDGVSVSGLQPFKAMLRNRPVTDHVMYWQVDGDRLNLMETSYQDYPHKEAWVDLSGWNWRGSGPYVINFVAKNLDGTIISQQKVNIHVR